MKPTSLLKSAIILVFINAGAVFAQDDKIAIPISSPFAKGSYFQHMSNDLGFAWKKLETDDVSKGNRNNFMLHYEGTYFVIDNVGIGLGISSERTRIKNGDSDEIQASLLASVNVMYGHSFDNVLNIYGKAAFRAGYDKYNYKYAGYSEDSKYNELGVNLELGAPLSLGSGEGFLFTPYFGYDYGVSKDDNYKDASSGFFFGSRLNISLPCASYAHNCSQVRAFSERKYLKGTNVIGGSSSISLNAGSQQSSYIGDDPYNEYTSDYSLKGASLGVNYYHYILNNLALGGKFDFYASGEKNKDNDYKESSSSWMIMPQVRVNVPCTGEFNNAFGILGYGLGTSKKKSTLYNDETTETNYNNSKISFGAGYNLFITKALALVPILDYSIGYKKNSDTDSKDVRKGFGFGFACSFSF